MSFLSGKADKKFALSGLLVLVLISCSSVFGSCIELMDSLAEDPPAELVDAFGKSLRENSLLSPGGYAIAPTSRFLEGDLVEEIHEASPMFSNSKASVPMITVRKGQRKSGTGAEIAPFLSANYRLAEGLARANGMNLSLRESVLTIMKKPFTSGLHWHDTDNGVYSNETFSPSEPTPEKWAIPEGAIVKRLSIIFVPGQGIRGSVFRDLNGENHDTPLYDLLFMNDWTLHSSPEDGYPRFHMFHDATLVDSAEE